MRHRCDRTLQCGPHAKSGRVRTVVLQHARPILAAAESNAKTIRTDGRLDAPATPELVTHTLVETLGVHLSQ